MSNSKLQIFKLLFLLKTRFVFETFTKAAVKFIILEDNQINYIACADKLTLRHHFNFINGL